MQKKNIYVTAVQLLEKDNNVALPLGAEDELCGRFASIYSGEKMDSE